MHVQFIGGGQISKGFGVKSELKNMEFGCYHYYVLMLTLQVFLKNETHPGKSALKLRKTG